MRSILLSAVAVLALSTVAVAQSEPGGIKLSPEVMNAPDSQEKALSHVVGRLQQSQQLKALNSPSVGPNSGAANSTPDVSTSRQQAIDKAQSFAARRAQQQQLQMEQQALSAPPQSTTVINAIDSPVVVGSGNTVTQQVAKSTTIGGGSASSSIDGNKAKGQANATSASQSASTNATSIGGNATATAINSNVVGQGNQ
jgi:hypothetical protein